MLINLLFVRPWTETPLNNQFRYHFPTIVGQVVGRPMQLLSSFLNDVAKSRFIEKYNIFSFYFFSSVDYEIP